MKTTVIKNVLLIVLITLSSSTIFSQQSDIIKWQGGASDRVYASPSVIGDKIFIGSVDGKLFCKDLESGRSYYQYQTNGIINSSSLVYNNYLLLVSGNDLICFDPETISEKWRFITEAHPDQAKFDEWDYHHSSPILHEGVVYFGCGNGVLYGLNPENGHQVFSWSSNENSPIRSTPTIVDDILYFGDWEGVIYAVDLITNTLIWSSRTWTGEHYDNFAGIVSHVEVGENLVYYGARNQTIKALFKSNGAEAWSYTSPDGGWISGDPIIHGEYMLIGGSDNHKMICFNASSGEYLWDFEFPGNCFSKPIIVNNKIVFTTGNAYANNGINSGRGFIHALNLPEGNLFNEQELPGNVFSSPVLYNGHFYVGCDNKNLYALDGLLLAGIETNSISHLEIQNGNLPLTDFNFYLNPINNNYHASFFLNKAGDIKIKTYDLWGRELTFHDFPGREAGPNKIEWKNDIHSYISGGILIACLYHNGKITAFQKIVCL